MSEKRLTISLPPAALACGIVCLCAGFVLVFILGLLLGRGHNLEERIPKLERILPERATPAPPHIIAEDAAPAKPEQHVSVAPPTVIPQGDLAFRDTLKTPAPQRPAPTAAPPAKAPAQTTAGQSVANQSPPGDNQVYQYVYQAAAYKSETPCIAFVDRLNKAGFRARMDRSESGGVIWYRAMIDFTGKPDDTDALREAMQKYGVQRLIMRSKIPAQ